MPVSVGLARVSRDFNAVKNLRRAGISADWTIDAKQSMPKVFSTPAAVKRGSRDTRVRVSRPFIPLLLSAFSVSTHTHTHTQTGGRAWDQPRAMVILG